MKQGLTQSTLDPLTLSQIDSAFQQQRAMGTKLGSALHQGIRQLLSQGALAVNTRLPASRMLAAQLSIARDTVEMVYSQLEAEGLIARATGRGSYVRDKPMPLIGSELLATTVPPAISPQVADNLSLRGQGLLTAARATYNPSANALSHSLPDLRAFPLESWLQLEKQVLKHQGGSVMSLGDPRGLLALRQEILLYLRRERGIKADVEQVMILSSSQQAMALCCDVLFNPGDGVFVEEPGYLGIKRLIQATGLQGIPIAIDHQGMDVPALINHAQPGRGVYITPSHQYPLGHALSIERRLMLLAWAQQQQGWIIEDDYDSEFTYDGQATAALQGLDKHQRTLYLGTFSKTLFPGLRLAYMVMPPQLVAPLVAAKQFNDGYTAGISQSTLAAFFACGQFSAHMRNMKNLYRARLAVLHQAVCQYLGHWTRPALPKGGLQLLCPLPDSATEQQLVQRAADHNIRVYGLGEFYSHPSQQGGLLFGFAAYTPDEIRFFIRNLAQALESDAV